MNHPMPRRLPTRPGSHVESKRRFRLRRPIADSRTAWGWLGSMGVGIALLQSASPARAQQAIQNMLEADAAANARAQATAAALTSDYTIKEGDFRLLLTPSTGLQWNDNVNLSGLNPEDDFILTPALGVTASYPLSEQNLLYLDITVGYNWYLQHSHYNSFALNSSSGTGLAFDLVIKDITIDIHDRVNYTQGTGQYGVGSAGGNGFVANSASAAVANTGSYGTFENTAGLLGTWDLNQVKLSLGYDHQNSLATTSAFNGSDRSSEMLNFRAAFQVRPNLSTGLESTAAFTTYDQQELNDNTAYTVGPFVQFTPGKFFTVTARGGLETYQFQETSHTIRTSDQTSWYGGLGITHQPTDWIKYSLDFGREVQIGAVSDLMTDWYVRPSVTWTMIHGLDLVTFFSYQHGNQGEGSTGNLPGFPNGTFDMYRAGISLQHAFTSWLNASLNYQYTDLSSGVVDGSYTQNLVALQLTFPLK